MWKKIVLSVALLGSIAFFGLSTEVKAGGHCHGGYGGGYNNYYGGGFGGGYSNYYYGGHPRGYGGYSPYGYQGGYRGGYYPIRGNNFYYGSRDFSIGIYSR